jgi:hypothetical protein
VSWEVWLAWTYGESHFLYHLHQQAGPPLRKLRLVLPLLTTLGGVAPWVALLGLAGLGVSRRLLLTTGGLFGLGFLLLVFLPEPWQALVPGDAGREEPRLTFGAVLFGVSGAGVAIVTALVARRLGLQAQRGGGRAVWFLVGWLLLEVAGSLALSPFPAARRVLGVVVAGSLLVGRLASRTCRSGTRRRFPVAVAAMSAALGLAFAGVDLREALIQKKGLERAVRWVRRQEPGAMIYYAGGGGFQFYAERAGLRRAMPGPGPRAGDWLVSDGIFKEPVSALAGGARPRAELRLHDSLCVRTLPGYYCEGAPLAHREGPRLVVSVYRLAGP